MTRSENMEHVEVLERLRGVLEHGKMGDKCLIAPDLVTAAIASLSTPQPPPGWVALIANLAAYIRAEGGENGRVLVESADAMLAPQPPAEAQPVGEVRLHNGLLYGRLDGDFPVGTKLYAHPPPSAPVGVEGQFEEVTTGVAYIHFDSEDAPDWNGQKVRVSLAQQPAPSTPVGAEGLPEKWRREAPQAKVDSGEDAALAWREAVYWCAFQLEAALAQQPAAAGEEIMVNAAHDVYTLPLQPSGLSSGPRFVVHVPGPEQPAAVDGVMVERALNARYNGYDVSCYIDEEADGRDLIRAALTAALAAQQGGEK